MGEDAAEEKKEDKPPEETWEEPDAPEDVYKKVMVPFLEEAKEKAAQLSKDLKDTEDACTKLVVSMGEKLTDKYTLQDFWATLREIFDWWKEADVNLKKIDAAKEKEREKKEKAA